MALFFTNPSATSVMLCLYHSPYFSCAYFTPAPPVMPFFFILMSAMCLRKERIPVKSGRTRTGVTGMLTFVLSSFCPVTSLPSKASCLATSVPRVLLLEKCPLYRPLLLACTPGSPNLSLTQCTSRLKRMELDLRLSISNPSFSSTKSFPLSFTAFFER